MMDNLTEERKKKKKKKRKKTNKRTIKIQDKSACDSRISQMKGKEEKKT